MLVKIYCGIAKLWTFAVPGVVGFSLNAERKQP